MRSVVLPVTILIASVSFVQAEEMLVANEFHVTEGGGFVSKTLKEMGSPQFQALVTAACAAYGADCSSAAATIRKAAEIGAPIVGREGSDVYITGNVTKHDGEEWYGIFRAPNGYEICEAKLDYGHMSITGPSTFNTAIVRTLNENGLGFYAVIPKNRPSRQWIDAYFVIKYVKSGATGLNMCAQTGSNPWLCKGQTCSPLNRL
jgi:hypothetical protein